MIKDLNPNNKHLMFTMTMTHTPIRSKKKSFFVKFKEYLISSWHKVKLWFALNWNFEDKEIDPCGIDYTTEYINSKVYEVGLPWNSK